MSDAREGIFKDAEGNELLVSPRGDVVLGGEYPYEAEEAEWPSIESAILNLEMVLAHLKGLTP